MSLMLRQACEEPLSKAGLGNYHAGIEMERGTKKSLGLFSNCGQLFLTVPGIEFSSTRLKISEVEYSAKLLNQWLISNRKKIDRYVIALENREANPVPENILEGSFKIRIELGYTTIYPSKPKKDIKIFVTIATESPDRIKNTIYTINQDGKVINVEMIYESPMAMNKTVRTTLSKAHIKRIEGWTTQYLKANAAIKQLEEARTALSETCALV